MPINDERMHNTAVEAERAQQTEAKREEIRRMSEEELMEIPLEELMGLPEVRLYYENAVPHHQEEIVLKANPHIEKIIMVIEKRRGSQ